MIRSVNRTNNQRHHSPSIVQAQIRKGILTMVGILWAVVVILVILWLIGFLVVHISSGLIHILLIIAVIVLLYNLFVGMRRRV